jgi:hypothetical protein
MGSSGRVDDNRYPPPPVRELLTGSAERTVDRPRLLDGACNLVRNANIAAGQRVLILAEKDTSSLLVDAIWEAVSDRAAMVSVLRTDHWHKLRDNPPAVFLQALDGVDVLIGAGEFLHPLQNLYLRKQIYNEGLFYLHNEASTPQLMASDYALFPLELLQVIGDYIVRQIVGRTIRITTPLGTDIRMSAAPETIGGYWYPYRLDAPGHKKAFPGGAFTFYPGPPAEGVIAFEGIPRQLSAPKVHLDDPLRVTFHDSLAVHLEGDCADWLRHLWDTEGDANSGWLGKCMWGIHPKAQSPDGRGASNPAILNLGMGNSTQYGGPAYSRTWFRGFIQHATVTADDITVIDEGRLCALDAPPVVEACTRLGYDRAMLVQLDELLANCSDL